MHDRNCQLFIYIRGTIKMAAVFLRHQLIPVGSIGIMANTTAMALAQKVSDFSPGK
jgi:hypothetical protein